MPRICIGRCALSLGSAVSSRSARLPRGSLSVCIDSAGNEREDKGMRIDLDVALSNAGRTENTKHKCGVGTSDAVMAGTREREDLLNDRSTKWLNMRKRERERERLARETVWQTIEVQSL